MGSGRQARLYMAVASFGCHADCAASTAPGGSLTVVFRDVVTGQGA